MDVKTNRASSRRPIGVRGPSVSLLGVGGGTLSGEAGREAQEAMLTEAWRLGLRYFDTAPLYLAGESERRIGRVLQDCARGDQDRAHRDYVISTKVGRYPSDSPRRNFDYSAEATRRSLEASIRRLGGARIGIVLIHDVDVEMHGEDFSAVYAQVVEECFPVLAEARDAGLVDAIGLSARQAEVCLRAIDDMDLDCVMMAGSYSLLNHEPLTTLFPSCEERNVGVLLASPFNSGILATGRPDSTYGYRAVRPDTLDRVSRINAVCARHEVPIATAALLFASFPRAVRSVVVGSKSPEEIDRNMAAFDAAVPDDFWRDLVRSGLLPEDAPTRAAASSDMDDATA